MSASPCFDRHDIASRIVWCLRFLLLFLLLQDADGNAASEGFQGWTCDELTPDLCDLTLTKGRIPIGSDGLWVTYWKYSSSSSSGGTSVENDDSRSSSLAPPPAPVIMVHGGPGMTHNYMLPLKQLACRPDRYGRTRDVYFYDQGGCGESMQPVHGSSNTSTVTNTTWLVEEHPYLLDPQYYATVELPAIVEHLGFDTTGYHVVANSWGTILAQYFVLNTPAKGLKSLTLSGPLSDGDLYASSQWSTSLTNNLGQLPPFLQKRIHKLEEEKAYDSEEYQAIDAFLTGHFTCRTQPAPDCFAAIWDGINSEVYVGLQGPSEFTFGGELGGFNTTPRLHTISVPVLLTSGEYDTMRPPVVDAMYREIPLVEWKLFDHSGHVTMIDDAGWMNNVVDNFLSRVEEASWFSLPFQPLPSLCGPEGCIPKYKNDVDETVDAPKAANVGYSLSTVIFTGIVSFFVGALWMRCRHDSSSQYEMVY
mmetsp:Transcript_21440/g.53141  ORF Transcript_21440/g.53141 Transcript_21440/m.53141 type:complete len:477 (+) Transcript_21440:2626-4056(+)